MVGAQEIIPIWLSVCWLLPSHLPAHLCVPDSTLPRCLEVISFAVPCLHPAGVSGAGPVPVSSNQILGFRSHQPRGTSINPQHKAFRSPPESNSRSWSWPKIWEWIRCWFCFDGNNQKNNYCLLCANCVLLFSCLVVSDSLWPHGL